MKNLAKTLVVSLLSIGGGHAVHLPCSNAQGAHRVIRPFTLHLSVIRGLFQTGAATESSESERARKRVRLLSSPLGGRQHVAQPGVNLGVAASPGLGERESERE